MAKITCYGGVGEIGGNKFLLEDRGTKVFLDFGATFIEGMEYFNAGISPRIVNGAGDYFEFRLLPEIPGLYSKAALQNTKLRHTEPDIDAIIVSHYHMDHVGRINFVDEDIPIYCGATTNYIYEADSESSTLKSPFDGHKLKMFRTGDKLEIGSLEIIPVHVDHSIPGAYGFIIHTSDGAVVYTGDFRFHGPMGFMTHEFAKAAADSKPTMLLIEGTRVSREGGQEELTEADVITETVRVMKNTKGLVFSSFRGSDMDRVNSFFKACNRMGRKLVVSMRTALLLKSLQRDKHLKVPSVGKDVLVYIRRKKTGKYDDEDYYKWERQFLSYGITAHEVRKHASELFLHLDVQHFPELIDIKPDKGGAYIHAASEAFNEEGEQEEQVIRNWVDHFGFSYHHIHASGHAPIEKVRQLVRKINAKRTVPIHTEHPELFLEFAENILSPRSGEPIKPL